MIKIVLFGTGNVATHLFEAFNRSTQAQVIQVYNHRADSLLSFQSKVATTTSLSNLKKADLYLLAIKDTKIESTVEKLHKNQTLIAHTSGSLPLLSRAYRNGVFYPLQTFSRDKEITFSKVPICIEASTEEDQELLLQVGKAISKKIYRFSSEQRKYLHLAAVFASNFTNELYRIAEKICLKKGLPFEILYPLILETAQKIEHHSPRAVQTGPAIRGDQKTIDLQLQEINSPELQEIYTLITTLIQNDHESEL